ncbi:MAG: GntP family permease [Bdellovibrionales bacterium]
MFDMTVIILSLLALIVLAYRGYSVLFLAPLLAVMAAVFSSQQFALAQYTEVFMQGFAGFAKSFFPLFLLGAMFGYLMEQSGSAKSIAIFIQKFLGPRWAILTVTLACALLTYGGVSLFVVAFAVLPIAQNLFREAKIPKRLIPGTLALGSFTFTMTALPGTPQIQNSIPIPYFGTDIYAAPGLGLTASLIMFLGGVAWLSYRARRALKLNLGYEHDLTKDQIQFESQNFELENKGPGVFISLLPLIVVLFLNFILTYFVFKPSPDFIQWTGLSELQFKKSVGLWSLIVSLSVALILALVLNWKRLKNPAKTLNEGAMGALLPILNTASEVGYGTVIAGLTGFLIIRDSLMGISDNPMIVQSISVATLAGITGSASGGLSIALEALGKNFVEMAQAASIPLEVMHRLAVIACGGLDSLPHNGAVITLLSVSGLSHKQSYLDIGVVTVVLPTLALGLGIGLASLGFF